MSIITRLTTTGSDGFTAVDSITPWESQKRIDMFNVPGLYPMFLRIGSHVRGVILPGFDSSLDYTDTARPLSVNPYRDINKIGTNGFAAFTDWMTVVPGYTYYGEGQSSFISPLVLRKYGIDAYDPIAALRDYILQDRRAHGGSSKWDYLMKGGTRREDKIALPNFSTLVLLNVWSANTNERAKDADQVKNRVLVLKKTAYEHLERQLNEFRPGTAIAPRDADWPDFLRGDITHPEHAVEWGITNYVSPNGFESGVLDLGNVSMVPGGGMTYTGRTVRIPQEALAGRYDLTDTVNVLHIPTAEEIVELLVGESLVPYELLREVCGPHVSHMPERKGAPKSVSPAPRQPQAYAPAPSAVTPPAPAYAPSAVTHQPQAYTPAPVQNPWNAQAPQENVVAPVAAKSLLQDDPDDDIPMGDSSGNLTPEEARELQQLVANVNSSKMSMSTTELVRLSELRAKQGLAH